jgi:hypothetical protein
MDWLKKRVKDLQSSVSLANQETTVEKIDSEIAAMNLPPEVSDFLS